MFRKIVLAIKKEPEGSLIKKGKLSQSLSFGYADIVTVVDLSTLRINSSKVINSTLNDCS